MKLIVANWKMNPNSQKEAIQLFNSLKKSLKNLKKAKIVICPPFVFLPLLLKASAFALRKSGLAFGSQNCFWQEKGAFTGEISPKMLRDLGVEYVILGHSERRKIFAETDKIIAEKLKLSLETNLFPIVCVGETKEEKKRGKTFQVLEKEIKIALKKVPKSKIRKVIIAYEPIWAIGTKNSCSPDEVLTAILFIRKLISKLLDKKTAQNMRILYGGSVISQNAEEYLGEKNINGLLIGGASLDVKEFLKIVKIAQSF